MDDLILRLQAASLPLFMFVAIWFLASAIGAALDHVDREGDPPTWRHIAGTVLLGLFALGAVLIFGSSLVRRAAEQQGIDASWLLNSRGQLLVVLVPIIGALVGVGLFSGSVAKAALTAVGVLILAVWPQPVVLLALLLYRSVSGGGWR